MNTLELEIELELFLLNGNQVTDRVLATRIDTDASKVLALACLGRQASELAVILEKYDTLLVATQFAVLSAQLDEGLLVLEETGSDDVGLMLEVALLLSCSDEGPAEQTS